MTRTVSNLWDDGNAPPRTTQQDTLSFCLAKLQSVGIQVAAVVLTSQSQSSLSWEWISRATYEAKRDVRQWERDQARGITYDKPRMPLDGITSPQQLQQMRCRGIRVLRESDVEMPKG